MNEPNLLLEVKGLRKRFGSHQVLVAVDLTVPRGSVVSVLGRSGAGKSVLLKSIAGLLTPDGGEILFENRPRNALPESGIRRAYLFQGNALFDSLTAFENVALPLEQNGRFTRAEVAENSRAALHRLGLADFAGHYPDQLSGGMQKRLALARALVTKPELMLFDEPTAGLDPLGRTAVFAMIARYSREFGFTAVIVTHDILEALAVSDSIAVLDEGRIFFQGAPAEFDSSENPFVTAMRTSTDALRRPLGADRLNRFSGSKNQL